MLACLMSNERVYLLGLWQSAWSGHPDLILEREVGDWKVPVGIGAVVPVAQLIALLDSPPVDAQRHAFLKRVAENTATIPD